MALVLIIFEYLINFEFQISELLIFYFYFENNFFK